MKLPYLPFTFFAISLFINWDFTMPTHNRKYQFAMSSFVRIHGHSIINNHDIKQFCLEWSEWGIDAPLSVLTR